MENSRVRASDIYESSLLALLDNPSRALRLARHCLDTVVEFDILEHQVDNLIGSCYSRPGITKPSEAVYWFTRATTQDPACPQYAANLAYALMLDGKPDRAEEVSAKLLKEHPGYEDGVIKLFNSKMHQGNFWGGLGCLEAYSRQEVPFNKMALGLTELLLSEMTDMPMYYKGIVDFKARYDQLPKDVMDNHYSRVSSFTELKGENVRVFLEQGLGDAIMMIPYIRRISEIAKTVTVVSVDHDNVIDFYKALNAFSGNVYFQYKDFNAAPRYSEWVDLWMLDLLSLGVPANIVTYGQFKDLEASKRGICWRGNPKHPNDWWRSIQFEDMKPFISKHGPALVSLQSNLTAEEAAFLESAGVEIDHTIPDPAALISRIEHLEGVITVDTFMAHMAGHLGVDTFTLLAVNNDWRWGTKGNKTDWYESMTLLRQKKCGDWKGVIDELDQII